MTPLGNPTVLREVFFAIPWVWLKLTDRRANRRVLGPCCHLGSILVPVFLSHSPMVHQKTEHQKGRQVEWGCLLLACLGPKRVLSPCGLFGDPTAGHFLPKVLDLKKVRDSSI